MTLYLDPPYGDLTDEERDALAQRIFVDEFDARDFVEFVPARVRRRYLPREEASQERAARAALAPRSGNVRVEPRS